MQPRFSRRSWRPGLILSSRRAEYPCLFENKPQAPAPRRSEKSRAERTAPLTRRDFLDAAKPSGACTRIPAIPCKAAGHMRGSNQLPTRTAVCPQSNHSASLPPAHCRSTRSRRNFWLPPAGTLALTCWVVPSSDRICSVTPALAQEPESVSALCTPNVKTASAAFDRE